MRSGSEMRRRLDQKGCTIERLDMTYLESGGRTTSPVAGSIDTWRVISIAGLFGHLKAIMFCEHGLCPISDCKRPRLWPQEAMSRVQASRTKENLHPEDTRDGKTTKFRSSFVLLDVAGILQYLQNLAFLVAGCGR